jgi:hypothetical protein
LLGWDVTAEAGVIHHVTGFLTYIGSFNRMVSLVYDETYKESLA